MNQNNKKLKLLFICKKRNDTYGVSFGLINSCQFICNALHKYDIECKVIQVIDNNCIDKEVHQYQPTHVFIEALWVVPEKFKILISLHPHVQWFVRVHSNLPFLANEGMAIHWLREYYKIGQYMGNLHLSANNTDLIDAFHKAYNISIYYHPNIYCPPEYDIHCHHKPTPDIIDIGCFGSIRPMKNHLIQGVSAISFGNEIGKKVRFHINSDRVEQKGESALKNLEEAFKDTNHELVKHDWMNHKDFIHLVRQMDLGMQMSFSETFNIVAADFVSNNIPIVGSEEIYWLNSLYKTSPTDLNNIVLKLFLAYHGRKINLQFLNFINLKEYNHDSIKIWLRFLGI